MRKQLVYVQLTIVLLLSVSKGQAQEISDHLFGQNLWLTDRAEGRIGYVKELWPTVEKSGAKIIRIGGNGYNNKMPNDSILDNWVSNIKAIGAEPLMQVSTKASAQESARLVRHFNSNEETRITYWCIGNEPYHMAKMSVDSISTYIKEHASAMKVVDPTIKIQVPDLAAYYNDAYEPLLLDNELSIAGRDENGYWYVDGINFHNYPNAKDYTRADVIFYSVSKMRGMVMDLKEDLETANEKYARYNEDALNWSLTEFNITYDNPDDLSVTGIAVPSFINGQFWVDVFCMAMEYGAFTVTPWCIQESDRASTYFGYIGGPPDFLPHSTFYHMQMLANHMKGAYVKIITNNPYVKAYGAKAKNQSTVVLMNQDEDNSFTVDLKQLSEDSQFIGLRLESDQQINANYSVTLKPNSTQLLTFDSTGSKKTHLEYDVEMAKSNLAPKVLD